VGQDSHTLSRPPSSDPPQAMGRSPRRKPRGRGPGGALGHEALGLTHKLSHPLSLAAALIWGTMLHRSRRETPASQERAEALMDLACEQGFAQWSAEGEFWRGWARVEQGQVAKGIAQMHQGLTAKPLTGAALGLPAQLAQLVGAYGKAGQVGKGLGVLSEALVMTESTSEC
jgi:hypothetical protein